MNRRQFLYNLGMGLAAVWAAGRLFGPKAAWSSTPGISLAFLADAHLPDGDPTRPEALALARAVAEIKTLKPRPTAVLFAGDLAHDGNPQALALGTEILSEFDLPVLAVRGEGDGPREKDGPGWGLFGQGRFIYGCEGVNLLGLDTVRRDTPAGPAFALGEAQLRWANRVLADLDPAKPLLILSHAPLIPVYRPWGQWTLDSGPLLSRLSRFKNVLAVYGHVHQAMGGGGDLPFQAGHPHSPAGRARPVGQGTEDSTLHSLSLPATSWPLPPALVGTPRRLNPGLGPKGCGWAFLPLGAMAGRIHRVLWEA